jgi:hypothetical protein
MAVQGIIPPKFVESDGGVHLQEAWIDFKEQMTLYFLASGQKDVEDNQKVSLLLFQMGSSYLKVYNNELIFAQGEDKKKYETVVSKFDDYFAPKKLTKAYITKFQSRKQKANETLSQYVTELRSMAKYCGFGQNEDTMLAVQISNGVSDQQLRKKLWDEDLTLAQVLQKCNNFEVRKDCADLYEGKKSSNVNMFRSHSRGRSRYRGRSSRQSAGSSSYDRSQQTNSHSQQQSSGQTYQRGATAGHRRFRGRSRTSWQAGCSRCGQSHGRNHCPASGKRCAHCKRFGHFESMCFAKLNVHCFDANDENVLYDYDVDPQSYVMYDQSNDMYGADNVSDNLRDSLKIYAMGTTNIVSKCDDKWSVLLRTPYDEGKGALKMKIDTQAQCNVLSKTSFDRMSKFVKLSPTNLRITAFGNSSVYPVGRTIVDIMHKSKLHKLECEVVDAEVPNIIGAKDSEVLGLVRRVYLNTAKSVNAECTNVPKQNMSQNEIEFIKQIPNWQDIPQCVRDILIEYRDRFPEDKVGKIPGQWSLSIDPEYQDGPKSFGTRPIPEAIRGMTKDQLDYLERNEIIAKVPKESQLLGAVNCT